MRIYSRIALTTIRARNSISKKYVGIRKALLTFARAYGGWPFWVLNQVVPSYQATITCVLSAQYGWSPPGPPQECQHVVSQLYSTGQSLTTRGKVNSYWKVIFSAHLAMPSHRAFPPWRYLQIFWTWGSCSGAVSRSICPGSPPWLPGHHQLWEILIRYWLSRIQTP